MSEVKEYDLRTKSRIELPFWRRSLAVTALAGLVLAGCTASTTPSQPKPTTTVSPTTTTPNKAPMPEQLPFSAVNQAEVNAYNALVKKILSLKLRWTSLPGYSNTEQAVDIQPDGDVLVLDMVADKPITPGDVQPADVNIVVGYLYPKGTNINRPGAIARVTVETSNSPEGSVISEPGTVSGALAFNELKTATYGKYDGDYYQELVRGEFTDSGYVDGRPTGSRSSTVALKAIGAMDGVLGVMAKDNASNTDLPNFFPTMPPKRQSTQAD